LSQKASILHGKQTLGLRSKLGLHSKACAASSISAPQTGGQRRRQCEQGRRQPGAYLPAAHTTMPAATDAQALAVPPTRVKSATNAVTNIPALPNADAVSTRSWMR